MTDTVIPVETVEPYDKGGFMRAGVTIVRNSGSEDTRIIAFKTWAEGTSED